MKHVALLLLCLGQIEFHPDLRAPDLFRGLMQPTSTELQQDDHGVRITLPAGKKHPGAGLMTKTAIRGDFEVTLAYEILQVDRPKTGYGAGVSLYAAIDQNNHHAISLARRVAPDGKAQFVSNRMLPTPPRDWVRSKPSAGSTGKLRIRRSGAVVQFFYQEDPEADFILLNEVEYSAADLRLIQVGANGGNSDAGVDVRLLDFTLTAEALPETAAPPPAPAPARPEPAEDVPPRRRSLWPVVLGLVVLLAAGAATWWFRRQPSARKTAPQAARPVKRGVEKCP